MHAWSMDSMTQQSSQTDTACTFTALNPRPWTLNPKPYIYIYIHIYIYIYIYKIEIWGLRVVVGVLNPAYLTLLLIGLSLGVLNLGGLVAQL